ncbi:hypothetical protein [Streptomyces sp. NPDC000405]|uniref:hypothetical protein n=1 Tax=Streptomyces sp. NPDC000405 TaxID=3161033 RepID=UPI00398D66F0
MDTLHRRAVTGVVLAAVLGAPLAFAAPAAALPTPHFRCPNGTVLGEANRGTWTAHTCYDRHGHEVTPIPISAEEYKAAIAAGNRNVFI